MLASHFCIGLWCHNQENKSGQEEFCLLGYDAMLSVEFEALTGGSEEFYLVGYNAV